MLNSPIIMPKFTDQINLVLVGCGGTGSWVVPALCRLALALTKSRGVRVGLSLCDPDVVKPHNFPRQNFSRADVGHSKAMSLAQRYSLMYGLPIETCVLPFEARRVYWRGLSVIVGCVDNSAARREIAKANTWWVDSGNERYSGQVVIGNGKQVARVGNLLTEIPNPAIQLPQLVKPSKTKKPSCGEMTEEQSLNVNVRAAGIVENMLVRLLLTRDLRYHQVWFNLLAESQRVVYTEALNV